MKLYSGKVNAIAVEIIRSLLQDEAIEVTSREEAIKDVEAVMKSYLQTEREVNDQTKDLLSQTGRGMEHYNKVRAQIAEHKGIRVGDETIEYLLEQIQLMLESSKNIDEIFAEDLKLRQLMIPVFKRHMSDDSELDQLVRAQLKHLKEGTSTWEVEYNRVAEQIRKRQGLVR